MNKEIPKRLTPTKKTIRRLYAKSGNMCAYPLCTQKLIIDDGIVIGEVCHISGTRPKSKRFSIELSNENRRAYENLILLCSNHHTLIDHNKAIYAINDLKAMKADHEKSVEKPFKINSELVNDIHRSIKSTLVSIERKIDNLDDRLLGIGISNRKIPNEEDLSFFNKFVQSEVDLMALLLKSQPTLRDCQTIFNKEIANEMFFLYSIQYRDLFITNLNGDVNLLKIRNMNFSNITIHDYDSFSEKLTRIIKNKHEFQYSHNRGNKYYGIVFSEKQNSPGISLEYWCFLDGRWVFFPKPYRLIRAIKRIEEIDLKSIAKWSKRLGLRKKISEIKEGELIMLAICMAKELKK